MVDFRTLRGNTTSVGGGNVATILVEVVAGAFARETVQTDTGISSRVLEAEAFCGGCQGEHGAEEGEEEEEGCGLVLHLVEEMSKRWRCKEA